MIGALTEDGLLTIAHSLANNSVFVKLVIPGVFGSTTANRLSQKVNEARKRNRLPPIKIEGEYCVWYGCVIAIYSAFVMVVCSCCCMLDKIVVL